MPLPSYLLRRDGGHYHFQLRLGKSLATCLKRSHLRFALRTTDSREARRRLVDNLGWAMEFKAAPDLDAAGLVLTRQLNALVAAGPPRDYKGLQDRRLIEDVVVSFLKQSRERDFDWAGRHPGLVYLFKVFTQQNIDAEQGTWAAAKVELELAPSTAPAMADLPAKGADPIASDLSEIKVSNAIGSGPQFFIEKGPLSWRVFFAVVGVTAGGRSPTGVTPTTAVD